MKHRICTAILLCTMIVLLNAFSLKTTEAKSGSRLLSHLGPDAGKPPGGPLTSMAAVSANDIWAVGTTLSAAEQGRALIEHWNGSTWSMVSSPVPGDSSALYGVTAISANNIWAVGDYSPAVPLSRRHYSNPPVEYLTLTEHWNGSQWSVVNSPNPGYYQNFQSVSAISTSDVWAAGFFYAGINDSRPLIEHWNGSHWSVVKNPRTPSTPASLNSIAAVSGNDIWAVGSYEGVEGSNRTLIEHWNGSGWSIVNSPNPGSGEDFLMGLAVISASDVWAVGSYEINSGPIFPLTEHWNGSHWSVVKSPARSTYSELNSVSEVTTSDIWAVGDYYSNGSRPQTLIEHWNGSTWSIVNSPNPSGPVANSLLGVATISAQDVWSVGKSSHSFYSSNALIEHWDGSKWSIVNSFTYS